MDTRGLAQDVRFAARTLGRSPGFAIVAVSILTLGIGATTAIFSLVSAVLLRPLPFVEPERVVVLWEDTSAIGGPARAETTLPNYVAWKERARSFEDMAALFPVTYNLTGEGEPERLQGVRATSNLFSLLGIQPILGRTFDAENEGPEASPVVVIGEDVWIRRFGADPNLVGRSIRLDGLSHTVVGIVPADFRFPNEDVGLWVPASFTPAELAGRNNYAYYVIARLEPETALSQAQAEMTAIARNLQQERGAQDFRLSVTVAALHEQLSRDARPMLVMLLAAVGAVLLITCANVANLLLARGADRRKELALRKALGAADGRVLRQLLTESTVLASLGVVAGVALSTSSFGYLAQLIPGSYPQGLAPSLDWRVLSITAGIAMLTVLLFGAGPAFAASRLDLNKALKKGVGATSGVRSSRMRSALVVAEIAITAVLLAAAGLLLRSYAQVLTVDPGFRSENLLIAETVLAPARYGEQTARSAFYERVLERVNALPAVGGAAYVNLPPLHGGGRSLITIEGRPPAGPEEIIRYIVSDRVLSADYLSVLGVTLRRGRYLDMRDSAEAPHAVVINEAMARLHWPDEDAIGKRLKLGPEQMDTPWFTVVGVVGDVRQLGLDVPGEPEMYFPVAQRRGDELPYYWPRYLIVRTEGDPMAVAGLVRDAVWGVDASQPVSNIRTMSAVLDAELLSRDTQLTLVGGFAVVALLLASVGLYGVLSYMVAQRRSELGLRMALGAQRGRVVRAVLRSALLLATLGVVLGLSAALGLARLLASFLFGVAPSDPTTLVVVSGLIMLTTILASYLPAHRAARVDPMSALRVE
jgi:putative ABC transport system permease protein